MLARVQVLMCQKVSIGAVTVFLGHNLLMSLAVNIVLTMLTFYVHYQMSPFPAFHDDPKLPVVGIRVSDNKLEILGMISQTLTIVAGLVFYFTNDNDCHETSTCENECRYCDFGQTGANPITWSDGLDGFRMDVPRRVLQASVQTGARPVWRLQISCHCTLGSSGWRLDVLGRARYAYGFKQCLRGHCAVRGY